MNSGDRVIDVGSEWRTFSNDKATKDPSRVGDTQNPLLSDGDLSTMIGKVTLKILNFTKFDLFLCQVHVCMSIGKLFRECVYEILSKLNSYISMVCKMWLFPGGSRKGLTFTVLWSYLLWYAAINRKADVAIFKETL